MTRYLIAAFVGLLLGLAAVGWIAAYLMRGEGEATDRVLTEPILRARGFLPARGTPKHINDAPPGARPTATLRGRILPSPPIAPATPLGRTDSGRALPPGQDALSAPGEGPPTAPLARGCAIRPEDVFGSCRAEIVALGATGRPWARLWWEGAVRLPDGGEVRRGPMLADEMEFAWSSPEAAAGDMIGVDAGMAGSASSLGWEVGGRYYPARWRVGSARLGAYARWGSDGRGAIGGTVLIGRP